MKRTKLDRFIGFFSPKAELTRIRARALTEASVRAYDIAKSFPTADWVSANSNSANQDTRGAITAGRNKARSLDQNNPFAQKIINVIVTEVIGPGIVPQIDHPTKGKAKRLRQEWKKWAETTNCDYSGQQNYYALQALALRSTIVSGEGLGLKKFDPTKGPQIQLLESDFIDATKDQADIYQGIKVDKADRKLEYYLYTSHPGDREAVAISNPVPSDQILHILRKERPGQIRAVTWFHPVAEKIKDLDDLQYATLIKQKISACFSVFITTNDDTLVNSADLKAKREAEFNVQPGTARYMSRGEDIKFANPPASEGYADFNRETLRAIASGMGLSYESVTNDYSQSNYSSSRMGHLQMRRNIENWRWNMFIPLFCEPTFKWFLEYCVMKGIITNEDIEKVIVKWVPPAFSLIDPTKEIPALIKEVRAGFKSQREALLEQGRDPDQTLEEIFEWNKKLDEKKVVLDTDPRRITQVGMAQSIDPAAPKPTQEEGTSNEGNQDEANASDAPDSGSD